MSKENNSGRTSSFFSSLGKYVQDIKQQVDNNAPTLIAQAKTAIDAQALAFHKAVGVKPPPFLESVENKSAEKDTPEAEAPAIPADPLPSAPPLPPVSAVVGEVAEVTTGASEKTSSSSILTPPTLPSLSQLTQSSFICPDCGTTLNIIESLIPTNRCRVCAHLFCSKCIGKSTLPVPHDLLHADFLPKPTTSSNAIEDEKNTDDTSNKKVVVPDEIQYICKKVCTDRVLQRVMEIFRDEINEKFESNFNDFIIHEPEWKEYFSFPEEAPEDTTYRQALRAAQIAVFVADLTGFSMTLKAVKVMYFGSELLNILVKGDILPMLSPLLESLKGYGIDGPSALLRLYYLGCRHTLREISNSSVPKLPRHYDERIVPGVLCPHCPYGVVDYVSKYISAAEWLYLANLPQPHNTMEWASWYLTKLVKRQGWTVLMCIHETTKLPDGFKCPAFAVVTRVRDTGTGHDASRPRKIKEAMIVVRGSMSPMDWTINLEEDVHDDYQYAYFHPSLTTQFCEAVSDDSKGVSADGHVLYQQGYIHKGMHDSAMALLDGYNVRAQISRLIQAGYDVKCVGHSLGAGVAAMVAMEIRNMYVSQFVHMMNHQQTVVSSEPMELSEDGLVRSMWQKVHRVTAVVYACPAFLSPSLAQAALADRLLINVVNGSDAIPRFSHLTLERLADELRECQEQAAEWMEEDKMDLQAFVSHLGKASDLHQSTAEYQKQRHQRMQEMRLTRQNSAAANGTGSGSGSGSGSTLDSRMSSLMAALKSKESATDGTIFTKAQRSAEEGFSTLKNMVDYWQAKATPTLMKLASTESTATAAAVEAVEAVPIHEDGTVDDAAVTKKVDDSGNNNKSGDTSKASSTTDLTVAATTAAAAPAAASESTASDSGAKKKDLRVTVTPGPIVHFYRENTGVIQAAIITWEHPHFSTLEILPTQGLKDHDSQTYRSMIDAVKFHYRMTHAFGGRDHSGTGRHQINDQAVVAQWFPVDLNLQQREEDVIGPWKDAKGGKKDVGHVLPPRQRVSSSTKVPPPLSIQSPVSQHGVISKPTTITRQDSTSSFLSALDTSAHEPTSTEQAAAATTTTKEDGTVNAAVEVLQDGADTAMSTKINEGKPYARTHVCYSKSIQSINRALLTRFRVSFR